MTNPGKTFLYRRGNGNDGNYPRALVTLGPDDNAYAALAALLVNDYIPGKRVRRHIIRLMDIDGEPDFGVRATVYEGPDGETEFGAAYITAELEPLDAKDEAHYRDSTLPCYDTFRKALDRGALAVYKSRARGPFQESKL